jgi:FADH2-dependent halogenase
MVVSMPTDGSGSSRYDAVVIGGGPAGSSAATTLAQAGHSVLVLEKQRFPRFHIGESLLPYAVQIIERLGLLDAIEEDGFVHKLGAEFTDAEGISDRVDFTNLAGQIRPYTFQVERARLDQILLDKAAATGAVVLQEATAGNLVLDNGAIVGVEYEHLGRRERATAPFVVDASGRGGRIANSLKIRRPNTRLRMVAVYKHLGGLDESNNPGVRGDIQVGAHADGWLWAIPIHEDVISVGTVTPADSIGGADREDLWAEHCARVPRIVQRLRGTEPLWDVRTEADYCYHTETVTGPNYLLAGDAGSFTDPIFSGGVYLALITGIRAGDTVDAILSGRASAAEALDGYERFYKTGYDTYFRLVYAYYRSNYDFRRYVGSVTGGEINQMWIEAITRTLSGDFWDPENEFTKRVRADRSLDTFEQPVEPWHDRLLPDETLPAP